MTDEEIEAADKLRLEFAALTERNLKSRVTRLCNSIDGFEKDMIKHGLPWYRSWSHFDLEILSEFLPKISDVKYAEKVKATLSRTKTQSLINVTERLLKR